MCQYLYSSAGLTLEEGLLQQHFPQEFHDCSEARLNSGQNTVLPENVGRSGRTAQYLATVALLHRDAARCPRI